MSITPPISPLAQALRRYGDELYRLALLLTGSPRRAASILLRATRRLASANQPPDEPALVAALLASLPKEGRPWPWQRLPGWVRAAPNRERALLAGVARLPRRERLALGLTLLRGFDATLAAPMLTADEPEVHRLVGAALLKLAPAAGDPERAVLLDPQQAPEGCKPTRTALLDGSAHDDSVARGHLALCEACRAAEAAWAELTSQTTAALRATLGEVHVPGALAERIDAQLAATAAGKPLPGQHWRRLVLLPLAVAALIGLLVLPGLLTRRNEVAPAQQGSSTEPRALIEKAQSLLYRSPDGRPWHGRWQILWPFSDGSSTLLNAEVWHDPTTGRQRLQLVHPLGGGPYEFQLANDDTLWYAVDRLYAPSIYPQIEGWRLIPIELAVTPAEREQFVNARFAAGAWGLAGNYLRQAQAAADLRSWGRRRADDGTTLEIVGFRGISPLAPPADSPAGAAARVTVLLAFDSSSGVLREVSELVGPGDGEQVGRSVWRLAASEPVLRRNELEQIFDLRRAWNGGAQFSTQSAPVLPELPQVPLSAAQPLERVLDQLDAVLPNQVPPGATGAVLLAGREGAFGAPLTTAIYVGPGRYLAVGGRYVEDNNTRLLPACDTETLTVGGREVLLCAGAAQSYEVQVGGSPAARISARGYSRAELITIIETLGQLNIEGLRNQQSLFRVPQPGDSAAIDALLGALATPPLADDSAWYSLERQFTRHNPTADTHPDPYHRLPYNGNPEELEYEVWSRGSRQSRVERVTLRRPDGTVVMQFYQGNGEGWYYDGASNVANLYPLRVGDIGPVRNGAQQAARDLLRCGANLITTPEGKRVLVRSELAWMSATSCLRPYFGSLLSSQQIQANYSADMAFAGENGPYLADIAVYGQANPPLTLAAYLDANGRIVRSELKLGGGIVSVEFNGTSYVAQVDIAGDSNKGVVLESWEVLRAEVVPASRIPADAFQAVPPAGAQVLDYRTGEAATELVRASLTMTETAALSPVPFFYLPPSTTATLVESQVVTGTRPIGGIDNSTGALLSATDYGIATRQSYLLGEGSDARLTFIIQGPADTFGTFLRRFAYWRSSTAVRLTVEGEAVEGWKVESGTSLWLLFERDGALVAMQADQPVQLAAVEQLGRLRR